MNGRKYIILGDTHGDLKRCQALALASPDYKIIQIGDFGIGFSSVPIEKIKALPSNFFFFTGNHDNRGIAHVVPHWLGHFGEIDQHFFFISGANSIDKQDRVQGASWWADEELNFSQTNAVLEAWQNSKAEIMLSHDCPQQCRREAHGVIESSHTGKLLDHIRSIRSPKLWIYGHHHVFKQYCFEKTRFVALKSNQSFYIDDVESICSR